MLPSAAAAATRVAGNVAARNKLLGANQAYAMQDQTMGAQAGHALKNVYDVRNLGGSLAQMLATEQHVPTNVDDLNQQLVCS